MIGRRHFLRLTGGVLAAPAIARSGLAQSPITLKLHHALPPIAGPHTKLLTPWAKKIEQETRGRLKITIFPSMQLGGTAPQLYDQVRDGVADIVWTAAGSLPDRFPAVEVFELPFVADRHAGANVRALHDMYDAHLRNEFKDVQPIGLFAHDGGVFHTARPVKHADDLHRLKLRAPTRLAGEALKAMGASPVSVPLSQTGEALAQKVLDGCVAPWEIAPAIRALDLTKFHAAFAGVPTFSTTVFLLAMNRAKYDALPDDLKAVLDKNSGRNAASLAANLWDEEAVAVEDNAKKRGHSVTDFSDHDVLRLHKVCEPVVQNWLKTAKERGLNGEKILADAKSFAAKYGAA